MRPAPHGTDILPRPRLDALLQAAAQGPLAVVHAGAGFGKSQAVGGWLARSGHRGVWLACTALDNTPARFWENLTRTFAQHRPSLAEKLRQLGFPDTRQAFDTFLAGLTAELYQDDLSVVFVFDDLHLIEAPLVLDFIFRFIGAGLENNCILLLTRRWPVFAEAPAVPTALLGAEELRFTPEETLALFEAEGVPLTPQQAADIQHYVAGWPIALPLVVLAMAHGGGRAGLDALSTSKHRLFDLFQREIFAQYTPAEQALLVKLSVLESFPRGLVQAVSGEQERDLGQLMAGNIFIVYDASDRRFYFHALYLEYLREKLAAVPRAELDAAYEKAARWCRDNGLYYDAVNYYRQCSNHAGIWETLLLFPATRHKKPEADFFIAQIEALPPAFRAQNPMTDILLAVMLVNNLRFAEALAVLDGVQARLDASEQSERGPKGQGSPKGRNAAKKARDDEEARLLLGECFIARGLATLAMEQNGFEKHFKKAAALLPQGSRRWGAGLTLIDLGPGLHLQSARAGEVKKSLACYTEGVPHMVRVLHGAGQGLDALCRCEALFLAGEVKAAAEPAYQALYAAQAAAQYDIVGNALFMLLRIYTAVGDYQNIQDTLEHVNRYRRDPAAATLGIWDIARGWFFTEMGESAMVPQWIRNAVQHGYAPVSIDRALLVRLRSLVAEGHYPEALALLEQFDALAKSKSAVITRLYVEVGRAVTHNYLGHYGDAMAALKAFYTLAKGNGLFMPVIEYGHRTRSLLERALNTPGHGLPPAWLEETHAKAGTHAKRHAYLVGRYGREVRGHSPSFGLSPQEVKLLDNLGQGLTREEMAEAMQLSLNTVKSMLKQVFSKLGAINSADAIRIAVVNQLI